MKSPNLSIFLIILTFFTSGCMMLRPGAVKSGKHLYESYFMGNAGIQYFIKPITLKFKNENFFETDFTFKYLRNLNDSAVMNFSIKHENNLYKRIDTLLLANNNSTIHIISPTLLYNERLNHHYISRFSTKLTQREVRMLFANQNWVIRFGGVSFIPSEKTKKNINKLNDSVFKLFD